MIGIVCDYGLLVTRALVLLSGLVLALCVSMFWCCV